MNKKEQSKMLRLERENAILREKLDEFFAAYREKFFEVVDLRIKIEAITAALNG